MGLCVRRMGITKDPKEMHEYPELVTSSIGPEVGPSARPVVVPGKMTFTNVSDQETY